LPNANIQSQLETGNIGIGNTGNIGNIVHDTCPIVTPIQHTIGIRRYFI
jgi:hypothetical protein